MTPKCCWCGSRFVKIEGKFWCTNGPCRQRQVENAIVAQGSDGSIDYMYLPLPRQVDYDYVKQRYLLGGGAAGVSKSHSARWGMYKRALAYKNYEGLLLRRTWPELEKHHFRLMEREAALFREKGIDAVFSITNRQMVFGNGSIIEGGHMGNKEDVQNYLSRERDEIVCDEGSTFDPKALMELSSRARTTKAHILADGIRGLFRIFTNPGGPSAPVLRDFFIDHEPDWEQFPPELRAAYRPEEWVYVPGVLEDNPYLPPDYERDLALLEPWRFQQLRHNDWDIVAGLFFTSFNATTHVQDLGDPGPNVQWFRSFDWGYVNPGDVLWWACLPDGRYYIRYEFKFSHADVPTVCEEIIKRTVDAGIQGCIRYTAADPALWSPNGNTGEDMNETFMRHGVPLMKARNERMNGWQRIREMLRLRPDNQPTVVIHPDCRYLIRSMGAAVSDPTNPEDVDTSIDDHALDTFRYGAMSRPAPTRVKTSTSGNTFKAAQNRIIQYQRRLARR